MNVSLTAKNMIHATSGIDVIWILIFSFLLVSTIVIHYYMICCISDKAPGAKTLFDVAMKDFFWFTCFGGSAFCVIDVVSRFGSIRTLCQDYPSLLIVPCILYVYAFVSVCIQMGSICIIRILCILNLTFMEETLGENLIRTVAIAFTLFWSIFICVLFVVIDDIYSGTAMTLFTHNVLPTGQD